MEHATSTLAKRETTSCVECRVAGLVAADGETSAFNGEFQLVAREPTEFSEKDSVADPTTIVETNQAVSPLRGLGQTDRAKLAQECRRDRRKGTRGDGAKGSNEPLFLHRLRRCIHALIM